MSNSALWFADYAEFIPDFDAFCDSLYTEPTCCLRVNTLRATPTVVADMLRQENYRAQPSPLSEELLLVENLTHPGTLRGALMGYYHSQALTSALASLALDPQPGELICDLCAAPGSKTSHMAQLMRDEGLIVANDRHGKRISMLEFNLKRLGVANTVTTCYPGQSFPLRHKFQRVLVDAPCSGEGNYRWDDKGRLRHHLRSSGNLPHVQRQLLLRGFDLLAPGGVLLYATCTYNPAENEAVIQALLEARPATLEPITLNLPHASGLTSWKADTYDERMQLCWRLYPHTSHSVGFFLARIRAAGAAPGNPELF